MKYEIATKSDSYIFAIEKNPIPISLGPNPELQQLFGRNDRQKLPIIPLKKKYINAEEIEAYRAGAKRIRWLCYSAFWFGWFLALIIAIFLSASQPTCLLSIRQWWKDSIIYEIWSFSYPEAIADKKVENLKEICKSLADFRRNGIGSIFIRPIVKVEKTGIGVIGHSDLSSRIGSFSDLSKLIQEAHNKDIRILIDFPLVVTSVAHPWFDRSALASRPENFYFAGFYYWSRNIPKSEFISSYKDSTLRYFHVKNRPDLPVLSWNNRNVSESIMKDLSFWARMGVDGFHLSSIDYLHRTPDGKRPDWDRIAKILRSISDHVAEFSRDAENVDKIFLFTSHEHLSESTKLKLVEEGHMDAVVHTELRKLAIGNEICSKSEASICECANEIVADLLMFHQNQGKSVWPIWSYGSAFTQRLASRVTSRVVAELLLMLELILPGTPLVYYGEEIGQKNCQYNKFPHRGPLGCEVENNILLKNASTQLKQTTIIPSNNSERLRRNFRRLIRLRKHSKTLISGETYITKPTDHQSFSVCRYLIDEPIEDGGIMQAHGDVVIFVANFGTNNEVTIPLSDLPPLNSRRGGFKKGKIVVVTGNSNFRINSFVDLSQREIKLGPVQGIVIHASSGYY